MLWTYRQNAFTGGRLDKELMGRQDVEQYYKGESELLNFNVKRQGCMTKRRGTDLVASGFLSGEWDATKRRVIPLVYSTDVGYYIVFDSGKMYLLGRDGVLCYTTTSARKSKDYAKRQWVGGENVDASLLYSVDSGLGNADIGKMDFCQVGDEIYVAHPSHRPMKISVDYTAQALPVITVENIDFANESLQPPDYVKATKVYSGTWGDDSGTKTVYYKVVLVDKNGKESFPSVKVSSTYGLPWPSGAKINITATIPDGEYDTFSAFKFYKNEGSGFGYIGQTELPETATTKTLTFSDTYITPDMTDTPRDPSSLHDFTSDESTYPHKVGMYQQRLVFASSSVQPFTIWMSCTGDFTDFTTHDTVRSDDAITATLAATELPQIFHIYYARDLLVLTESGEWVMSPVSGNAITPTSVSTKMHSAIGAREGIKPVQVGNELVFADQGGERLKAIVYSYASDGYESTDLSEFSQWITKNNGIVRMAFRKNPDSTVYCVLKNGEAGLLTYVKAQNMVAWSRMKLNGGRLIVDAASSKAVHRGSTEMLFATTDEDSGDIQFWMERDDTPIGDTSEIADVVALDGTRTLAAGAAVPSGMVAVGKTSGTVLSSGTVAEDSWAGYRIESEFVSVYPDDKGQSKMQIEKLNGTVAKIRVLYGSSFTVGPTVASPSLDTDVLLVPSTIGGKVGLVTSDVNTVLHGVNTRDPRIRISHDEPWPLTILSMATTYQVEGENLNASGNS